MNHDAAHDQTSDQAHDRTGGDDPAGEVLVLDVPGMTCGHCEAAVTTEIGGVPGVRSIEVDLATKLVTVRGAGLDRAAIVAAVDEAGFDVTGIRE